MVAEIGSGVRIKVALKRVERLPGIVEREIQFRARAETLLVAGVDHGGIGGQGRHTRGHQIDFGGGLMCPVHLRA